MLQFLTPKQPKQKNEFVNWEKTQKCTSVIILQLEAINLASPQFFQTKCRKREIERLYAAIFVAVLFDFWYLSNFGFYLRRLSEKIQVNHFSGGYSGSNLVVFFETFVSASENVKHSFYRGLVCIAKLLNTLREKLFCRYFEKHVQSFEDFGVAAKTVVKRSKSFVLLIWNVSGIISSSDSSLSTLGNIFWRCPFENKTNWESERQFFHQYCSANCRDWMLTLLWNT